MRQCSFLFESSGCLVFKNDCFSILTPANVKKQSVVKILKFLNVGSGQAPTVLPPLFTVCNYLASNRCLCWVTAFYFGVYRNWNTRRATNCRCKFKLTWITFSTWEHYWRTLKPRMQPWKELKNWKKIFPMLVQNWSHFLEWCRACSAQGLWYCPFLSGDGHKSIAGARTFGVRSTNLKEACGLLRFLYGGWKDIWQMKEFWKSQAGELPGCFHGVFWTSYAAYFSGGPRGGFVSTRRCWAERHWAHRGTAKRCCELGKLIYVEMANSIANSQYQ